MGGGCVQNFRCVALSEVQRTLVGLKSWTDPGRACAAIMRKLRLLGEKGSEGTPLVLPGLAQRLRRPWAIGAG
jgi:hypothetical protein